MKSHNAVKYIYNANPLYVHLKKHYCPQCKKRLVIEYESIIINSRSPEAKNYDFSVSDTRLEGDVEFRKSFFKCPLCGIQISFDEMKMLERKLKRNLKCKKGFRNFLTSVFGSLWQSKYVACWYSVLKFWLSK